MLLNHFCLIFAYSCSAKFCSILQYLCPSCFHVVISERHFLWNYFTTKQDKAMALLKGMRAAVMNSRQLDFYFQHNTFNLSSTGAPSILLPFLSCSDMHACIHTHTQRHTQWEFCLPWWLRHEWLPQQKEKHFWRLKLQFCTKPKWKHSNFAIVYFYYHLAIICLVCYHLEISWCASLSLNLFFKFA